MTENMEYERKIFSEIDKNLEKSGFKRDKSEDKYDIDKVALHRIFGPIIFILVVTFTLITSFYFGQIIGEVICFLIDKIGKIVDLAITNNLCKLFINNYFLSTSESILSCAGQIFTIYFFIYLLKDSGYLSRGVFIIDKAMNKIGLNGESFIPLISNFGCNVPGILSTRTINNTKSRFISIIISPLISCPAKLPVYIMISGIYFSGFKQSLIILSIYLFGIVLAIIISKILSLFIKNHNYNFVTEIPSYKLPNVKNIFSLSTKKSVSFIKNMASIIYLFTFLIWMLNNTTVVDNNKKIEQSFLNKTFKMIEKPLNILGFDYKMDLALLGGICAKESIPAILKTLYNLDNADKKNNLKEKISLRTAISFLIFTSLYCPCLNTLLAIKNELNILISSLLLIFYTVTAFFFAYLFSIFI